MLRAGGGGLNKTEGAIVDLFMGSEKHRSLRDIYQEVRRNHPEVDMATVERTLQLLCEYKIARSIRFHDQTLYEHFHPESHHDHLFCVKCGAIVEFYDPGIETLQLDNARKAAFRILMHRLDIFGVCEDCVRREATVRNLADCLAGEVVTVRYLAADQSTKRRLADMGLAPGATAEMLSDKCTGKNVIVMLGATRLMLDCELAQKVRVTPVAMIQREVMRGRRRRHRHAAEKNPPPRQ